MHSVALAWFHYIQNPVPNSRWQEEQCAIFRGPLNIHSNKTHLTWFTRESHYEPRDRKVWVSILAWNVNIKYWLIPGYHSVVLYKFNNKKAWQDFSESRSTQGLIEKNKNKTSLHCWPQNSRVCLICQQARESPIDQLCSSTSLHSIITAQPTS